MLLLLLVSMRILLITLVVIVSVSLVMLGLLLLLLRLLIVEVLVSRDVSRSQLISSSLLWWSFEFVIETEFFSILSEFW